MKLRGVFVCRLTAMCLCVLAMAAGPFSGTRTLAQESAPVKPVKAIKFGKLWDGKGKVWTNAIVIVEGDRIREVTTDAKKIPAGAQVIDLSKYYGLPGLIDVHTHMTQYTEETPGTPMLNQLDNPPGVQVFLARKGAMRTLEAGVTTVRDLGADQYMDMAMRNLINRGEMIGPRMFVVGYGLTVTNTRYKPGLNPPAGGVADGVPEVLRVVRQQIAAGADLIKMFASTGTDDDTTGFQTFNYEEIKAAVDTAHQFGKKIAIHSYGPDGARDAVRAGTDSLEHATDMDDATIAEMVKRGTFYVPTIDHNRYYLDNWQKIGYTDGFQEKTKAFIARNLETARKAHKAGVKFAMGSDAIYTMFGENTRELAWFVKAGMTPEEVLKTATTNAAELLGKSNDLGAVATGYYGDIVAVEGDPLADVNVTINKVKWVMKSGAVVVEKTGPSVH
ncbi:MAG TPA: amidohydrolase family protein [Candidatus Dormibacteraeota bacterium]|jgi:imidazolonepropionase-like amidohydrolase|nr:amidohydrolase family protein [Candidatus Dormibacteraeota bacterium]